MKWLLACALLASQVACGNKRVSQDAASDETSGAILEQRTQDASAPLNAVEIRGTNEAAASEIGNSSSCVLGGSYQRGPMMDSAPALPRIPGADSDGDGLSDCDEAKLGTDPHNADTDGDGLLDGWEVRGVNGYALASLNASPRRLDIFVWMDAMQGLDPDPAALQRIAAVFASSPIENRDGSHGITLHYWGPVAHPLRQSWSGRSLWREFFAVRSMPAGAQPIFHYMIWAMQIDRSLSTGISIEGIGFPDFIVALGADGGSEDEQVGTFIHELGHTLSLRHGGTAVFGAIGADASGGPNHLSVMNYTFQNVGVWKDGARQFGFQTFRTTGLTERSLAPDAGIGGDPQLVHYRTNWATTESEHSARAPIDWGGDPGSGVVSVDLDGDGHTTTSWPAVDNEWAHLELTSGGFIGSTKPLATLSARLRELSSGTIRGLRELTLDASRLRTALLRSHELNDLVRSYAK